MKPPRVILPLLAIALLAVLCISPLQTCEADVVKLRTGESIKGRPLPEQSDEEILVIEDYMSGAMRRLSWTVVDPADRDRLQEEWQWKNKALAAVMGHRITQRLQDGSTEDVRGLIEKEDETHYHLRRGGRILKILKSQVEGEPEREEMDPRDIWSPEQLVQNFLKGLEDEGADLENLTTRQHWRVAEFAEKAGDYETARTHYQACTEDAEFLLLAVAKQRLEGVEKILRDKAALKTLRDIRMALNLKAFRRARERIEGFGELHPEASEPVLAKLEKLKKDFTNRRNEYFQLEAKIQFPKLVLKLIKPKVQEKDVTLSDMTAWTRRELPDEAFKLLAESMAKRDDVTPEEARAFWENRRKGGWRTATYGAGTFIVNPPKIKPPKRRRRNRSSSSRGGSRGAGPSITIPKPPTRDGWWAKAAVKERVQWVMAFFAQNSGLFEVSEEPKWSNCIQCNGEGLESKRLSTGELMQYLCTRCGGAQRDMRVQFR
jgi:hypothetical protein